MSNFDEGVGFGRFSSILFNGTQAQIADFCSASSYSTGLISEQHQARPKETGIQKDQQTSDDVAENALSGQVMTDLVQPQHRQLVQVMDESVTFVLFYLHKTIITWTVALELSRRHASDGIADLRHTGLALN
ncbi:hypothetical protein HGM15179_015620 [Zosterops borbonicus]|uniref:Uncharacterized protein n=1 Tax=Zosterops borbonicus TaxID=364589 RepID=A0A8K1G438_9PASS|nr:hypothetical protein HGM15179_015620 [Zosterops borbonicus]